MVTPSLAIGELVPFAFDAVISQVRVVPSSELATV
jgi:hypothetical protein